ncbi:MAG: hypothetical protein MK135_07315 [Polyangiaceae bacterium]|nr:hypothetical protein [Polyangiaceae bacterium]
MSPATLKKIQFILRAESALLQLRLRRVSRAALLVSLALVFALLGITVLNFSAFQVFREKFDSLVAGAVVVSADLIVAGILVKLALREAPLSQAEDLARQARNLSAESLAEDFEDTREELREFGQDIRKIRQVVNNITEGLSGTFSFLQQILQVFDGKEEKRAASRGAAEDSPAKSS